MNLRRTFSTLAMAALLLLPTSCILAVDASGIKGRDSREQRADSIRLLDEKVRYLREIEERLAEAAHLSHARSEQGTVSDADVMAAEVRLLEARIKRVDAELELVGWRRSRSSDDDDDDEEDDDDEHEGEGRR